MARKSFWMATGKAMTSLMLVSAMSCAASVDGWAHAAATDRTATPTLAPSSMQAVESATLATATADSDPGVAVEPEAKPATDAAASPTDAPASDTEAAAPATTRLRRLRGGELNPAMVKQARAIILQHNRKPVGTEIPFEVEGKQYVGRIERHFHPIGGELRPWGWHPGCSLFAVEPAG